MSIILPSFAGIVGPSSSGGGGASAWNGNSYALSLDGTNDYITLASSVSFSGACTLSTWIKPSCDSDEIFLGVVSTTSFYFFINNEVMTFVPKIGASGISASGFTVSNGSWYNAVIVRDASNNITMYINGVSRATGSYSGALATPGLQSNSYNFTGLVDEYAMWDSDQSSNISAIYNYGAPGDITSLNPVGWWRMGDNDSGTGTTITDQGSGGNNGTLVNGPTFSTDVPPLPAWNGNSYALSFDGSDDFVNVDGVATEIASMTNFSCSAWIKKGTEGIYPIIFRAALSNSVHIGMFEYNNNLVISCISGGFSEAVDTGGVNIADDQWHHVLMTYEKTGTNTSTVKGYVDGNLRITNSGAGIINSNIDEAAIGRRPNGSGGGDLNYEGLIDEVAVFDITLTASDATSIYNSGVPADLTSYSPVGWWRMGDNNSGSGTTITDQGSGGNDGTLVNGPTFSTNVPS